LAEKENTISKIGIVFGREESGLTNDEVNLCNRVSTIPLASPYPSINLAQSVMIYAYSLTSVNQTITNDESVTIHPESFKSLKQKVDDILNLADITPDMMIYGRIHERITELSAGDIRLLHSVTSKLLEKL